MAIAIPVSASYLSDGAGGRTWCCARNTGPARNCSSIGQEPLSRSATLAAVLCRRLACLSWFWEPAHAYAEATGDEQLASWIGAHVRAFEFYQGAPEWSCPKHQNRRDESLPL